MKTGECVSGGSNAFQLGIDNPADSTVSNQLAFVLRDLCLHRPLEHKLDGTTYSLVCPFLNDDPNFSYGVEFGMLHARMRSGVRKIKDCFCRENQERILLLANRLGWSVRKVKRWDEHWFLCVMIKRGTRREAESR